MSKKKELFTGPYMPFFWDDFFAGVTDLMDDEIIAYQKLIWYQWRKGKIPISDTSRLKKIVGKDGEEFTRIWGEIKCKFPHGKNAKVEKVRTYTKSRNVNKLGGGCTQEHTPDVTPEHTPLKVSKSQSTKISDNQTPKNISLLGDKTTPPTLEQVKEYCLKDANYVNPREFFNYYEAAEWKMPNGKTILPNWKGKAVKWNDKNARDGHGIYVEPRSGGKTFVIAGTNKRITV